MNCLTKIAKCSQKYTRSVCLMKNSERTYCICVKNVGKDPVEIFIELSYSNMIYEHIYCFQANTNKHKTSETGKV